MQKSAMSSRPILALVFGGLFLTVCCIAGSFTAFTPADPFIETIFTVFFPVPSGKGTVITPRSPSNVRVTKGEHESQSQ